MRQRSKNDPYYVDHASLHVCDHVTYEDGKHVKKGDHVAHKERGYRGHVIGIVIRTQFGPLIRVQPTEEDAHLPQKYTDEDGNTVMPCRDIGKPRGKWVFL